MEYRPYQERTYGLARKARKVGHKRILLVAPTAAGKSVMAANFMGFTSEKGLSSIFFADRRELIFQTGGKCDEIGLPHLMTISEYDQEFSSAEDRFKAQKNQIIAKDTLWSRAWTQGLMKPPPGDVVHIDEAHGALAHTWQEIMKHYKDSVVFGWTATPCRSDGRGLGDFFTHMIQVATYDELIRDGYIVPSKVFAPHRPDLKGLKLSRGDYAKKALEARLNREKLVGDILEEWKIHSEYRTTIVFASGIDHSLHIRNVFQLAGISAEHIDGKTDINERKDILGRLEDGSLPILCNYGVATTGLDIPRVKYIVCARPTKSFSLWRQMGGRAGRLFEDHDHFVVQDHSDNSHNFGYPDEDVDWQLSSKTKVKHTPQSKPGDKKPKTAFKCPKCSSEYSGAMCPECGYKTPRIAAPVKMGKGELEELRRKKLRKDHTITQKQKSWDEFMGVCIQGNMPIKCAAGMYKKKYGVWPRGLESIPYGSQWQMKGKDYYHKVIKPIKDAVANEVENAQQVFGF